MKSVGLMTCYINNYGACLQAYALQSTIEKLGYECKIIRYTPVEDIKKPTLSKAVYRLIRDVYRIFKHKDYIKQLAKRRKFVMFKREYLCFGRQNYNTIESLYKNCPEFDVFVCGSDQLWNPLIHNNKNNEAYFLDFVPGNKGRIAYAPSFGISQFPDNCMAELKSLLSKFHYISVRESSGADIVEEAIGKRPRVVLDPTLLLSKVQWEKVFKRVEVNKPYILCYLFSNQEYICNFVRHVWQLTGYDVIVLPFADIDKEKKYKKLYNVGPNEFLWLISNAQLVITDSFHATAFSINFNTPFYSLLRNIQGESNNMNTRIYNMLEIAGLQNRLITDKTPLPEKASTNIDFNDANAILEIKRNEDIKFLKEALSDMLV